MYVVLLFLVTSSALYVMILIELIMSIYCLLQKQNMPKNLKQWCLVQLLSNWFVHHTPLILFMLMICMLVIEPMVIFWSLCFMSCMCVHFFKDSFLRWRFEDSLSLFSLPHQKLLQKKGEFLWQYYIFWGQSWSQRVVFTPLFGVLSPHRYKKWDLIRDTLFPFVILIGKGKLLSLCS